MDLGLIAEALVFYQDTHVVANHPSLDFLLRAMTPEVFIEMLESGYLNVTYEPGYMAVATTKTGTGHEWHTARYAQNITRDPLPEWLPKLFREIIGTPGKSERMADRALRKIGIAGHSAQLLDEAMTEFTNPDYTEPAADVILRTLAPTYIHSGPLIFEVSRNGDMLIVHSNIDFLKASSSPASLLGWLLEVKVDLFFAAKFGAEIASDHMNAKLMQLRLNTALARYGDSQLAIERFQEFVFNDARAIGQAVTSGGRTFRDLIRILERARKFKGWLRDKPLDADLLKQYFEETTKPTWIDSLPCKSYRWFILSGLGLAIEALGAEGLGTAAGLALSAADTFLLDKLLRGWKPNQFVNGPLHELVHRPAEPVHS